VAWRDGRAAVYVFNAGLEIEQVQKEAYTLFMAENGLGFSAFPSLREMEATVVGYGLSLLNAPEGAAGNMTSGGTDSITMAIKAAREFARQERGLVGKPNIVLPFSAHPAFDKAALLMDIDIRRTPLKGYVADPAAMDAATDDSTIMIVGSAPCFPYGLIDPIVGLGALAVARDLWLHVDACVGGYLAPFVRMNGGDIPSFDFEVAGVSSMSADLHKYGYCAKGASTVFFRSEALRDYMTFDCNAWPGGRMVTPTLAGTGGHEFPGCRGLSGQARPSHRRSRKDRAGCWPAWLRGYRETATGAACTDATWDRRERPVEPHARARLVHQHHD